MPSELRKALNLKQGDRVAVVLDPEGTVRLTGPRFPTVASLRGVAVVLKEPLSWEETETIAREDYLDAEYVNGD
ncbi:MAG: AbrB/MazE/SpoVT family DNA-binding domain-containing protein [Dehalococcoidia bacterium]|nr:AbrB/MazE/SpoVT family DNA-binding domain-containing protein [Dehalococcoidia bacterium]